MVCATQRSRWSCAPPRRGAHRRRLVGHPVHHQRRRPVARHRVLGRSRPDHPKYWPLLLRCSHRRERLRRCRKHALQRAQRVPDRRRRHRAARLPWCLLNARARSQRRRQRDGQCALHGRHGVARRQRYALRRVAAGWLRRRVWRRGGGRHRLPRYRVELDDARRDGRLCHARSRSPLDTRQCAYDPRRTHLRQRRQLRRLHDEPCASGTRRSAAWPFADGDDEPRRLRHDAGERRRRCRGPCMG